MFVRRCAGGGNVLVALTISSRQCSGYSLENLIWRESARLLSTRWVDVVSSLFGGWVCVCARQDNERAAKQQHKQLNCNTDIFAQLEVQTDTELG